MSTESNGTSNHIDVYQIVTNRIISILEKGTIPWQKPWKEAGPPMNLESKRHYRGINTWLLSALDYEQHLYLTWDQVGKLGARVKQGEHGHVVVFWKTVKKDQSLEEAENGNNKRNYAILRYYKVFNVEQCTGIPEKLIPAIDERSNGPLVECEAILQTMPHCPPIKHKQQKAFYHVVDDYINMPKQKSFTTPESYYSTLFHELVHSTGHEKRLNRKTVTDRSQDGILSYSIEELIAELGSSYLCNWTGILNNEIQNKAAYLDGWLKQLKDYKRFIVFAAAYAQKASDFILGIKEADAKDEVEQSEIITN